jgi:hypothetical protein
MELFYEIDDVDTSSRSIWSKELAELYFHQGCIVKEIKMTTIYHGESAIRTIVTTPITNESYFQ